ncbi:hypothetical protein EGI22_08845 [Lacihabitans sp. LS3-19]|uniref:methylmalonyl-CoA mutase family protein n=1 Tax=Lacihabitans sp. LS3-19 TaxID=2487335 RepID=UPI0020CCA3ED|nr:methylmalonyl-CoA mutase family protein [Lacihabitans sp. LS3-19]MCP9768019.1 hypothetical protein [Lacihabitans sp. LS3-19]
MKDFFEEFEPANYTEWRKLVEKELKRPLETYQISEGVTANPFLGNSKPSALTSIQSSGEGWIISQEIFGENSSEINRNIISALENGASGICIDINEETFDFETVFQGIFLNFIEIRFCIKTTNQDEFITKLKEYFQGKNSKLIFSGLNENLYPEIKDLGKIAIDILPNEVLAKSISESLRKVEILTFHEGIKAVLILEANENFYLNIAQHKAIKILWNKIAEAYNSEEKQIDIYTEIQQKQESPNSQTIAATQMAASSIMGGTDSVLIKTIPFDSEKYEKDFAPRITRNIQNILWNESFLFRVNDPSAGSYFIDVICQNLINEIWKLFIIDK